MVPLKYLSNFWRTLNMLLIQCEFNLILTWSANWVILPGAVTNEATTFVIADTKHLLYQLKTMENYYSN